MNPSSWCNPPPPGNDMDEESKISNVSSSKSYSGQTMDQIDPYIKNPEYVRYKRSAASRRSRSRSLNRYRSRSKSRSRSREREQRRKHRSRSRSRTRRRRSRSRSRTRRHRRHSRSASRSRSRSTSQSRSRHSKHKRSRKSRRSRSRSHDRRKHERKYNEDASRREHHDDNESKGEEEEADTKENAFKNDGSFLEMFKKMQEEKRRAEEVKIEPGTTPATSTSVVKKALPIFGKRRGGRVLKTGMVEKTKVVEEDELANATDPWSIYLKEVKRYKEACCDDDSKTRPLVK